MSFKLTEITFEKLGNEINYFLQKMYNKASETFSPSSPMGHILIVVNRLFQLSILYLKRSVNQFDLSSNNTDNYAQIRSAAIVAGHNPSRAVSASGLLRCQIKVSSNIGSDIGNGQIKIFNKTTIKNNTNGLLYHIDLGGMDEQVINTQNSQSFYLNIVQGEWVSNSAFTGTGEKNQSFELDATDKNIENHLVKVSVNGEYYEIKNHIHEMLPDEKAVVIRTSFSGGISIIFGNSNFGKVPDIGSVISVEYVKTDGILGNIYRKTTNDWKFIDDVVTTDGSTINFEKYFNIFIERDINFGADAESIELMRSLIPLNMNNYVLALPTQYAYAIKKLGVFSHVNAYKENETIKIVATPNIRIFKNRNSDYFSVDKSAFLLDSYEIDKLDMYLKKGGYIRLTQRYQITTPKLSYYIMNIYLRLYDDAIEENVNSQILDKISEYFLDLTRLDRVPRKDMINILSEIVGIDSIDVKFVSKQNEDYHINKPSGYSNKQVIGLDPVLGDIVFVKNEYPIIRGGWSDRNGIYYNETPLDGFSSVNIKVLGRTPRN